MKHVITLLTVAFFLLIVFSITGICQDNLPPEWVFDDDEEIVHWGGMNQLAALELDTVNDKSGEKRNVLLTVSTGADPYVFPDGDWNGFIPDIEPFSGKEYGIIYIGVRVNVSNQWQIYFVSEEDGTFTEAQRQNFQVDATGDFEDLEFEMTDGGWPEKSIKGFRLDPGTIAGIEAEIDYISLRGLPEGLEKAVDKAGKLAGTWGSLKN